MEKAFWDTEVLAPLVNASLDINNILPDSVLKANADSSMKIVYQNSIYTLSMDTLFKIPDTILHTGYGLPIPITLNPGQNIPFPSTSETTYQLPGVQLRTVVIKSGYVNFTVRSKVRESTVFVYGIPCATLNGVPFSINVIVPPRIGNTQGVYSQTFDLSGYTFDLTGISRNKINTIFTSLTASISVAAADTVLVNPNDSLIIDNTFYNMLPYYAKGYFGQNTFNIGPAQTKFTLFNRIVGGTIKLEDVKFNFKIENPIGLDARVYINNLSSINSRTGNTVNLVNTIIGSPININRASESAGIVYPTYANFPLTTVNSNIKSMIENLPDRFGYSIQINTNPLGNISGSNDFIYSDKLLKASIDMEIPLSLVATNLTLADTLALNISSSKGTQNVHGGTVTLFANNGFPFDAALQFYLLNDKNVIVDSVLGFANTIDAAPINASLHAIGKKLTKVVATISETKMNLLYTTKKVILTVKFNTSAQPQYIKIYSDYAIDVRLVGDFNYTVHLH